MDNTDIKVVPPKSPNYICTIKPLLPTIYNRSKGHNLIIL